VADAVLDSSAVLAFLLREPGGEQAQQAFPTSIMSTVNLTEVIARLIRQPMTAEQAVFTARSTLVELIDLDVETASLAGELYALDRAPGRLSHGDRCCIALAMRRGLPIITGDREWLKVELDVELRMIR